MNRERTERKPNRSESEAREILYLNNERTKEIFLAELRGNPENFGLKLERSPRNRVQVQVQG